MDTRDPNNFPAIRLRLEGIPYRNNRIPFMSRPELVVNITNLVQNTDWKSLRNAGML